ncbi:MAG: transporter, partial [Rhodospirillales bacterium]|nr:transporter [Rhodospirillales bacterium]
MPDTVPPPPVGFSHREIMYILSGTLLGMFLGAIDQTIVATALPAIAGEMHGMEHMSWVVSSYLLTGTASTLIYGKLGDIYGRRALFRIALAVFVLGSICCGVAQTMGQLIAARALQGLGGGGLVSLAITIIADIIPARQRGQYQGYITAAWGGAIVLGPVIGGFFVDALSWRWVFWINVPIGLVALAICNHAMRRIPVHATQRHIDYLGAALLLPAVVALLLVTTWGGTELAWASPQIIGLFVVGLVLVALFALQEMRSPEAILPPRLMRNPIYLVANMLAITNGAGAVGATIFLPLFLQVVLGTSASNSGLLLLPLMIGMTAGGFVTGRLIRVTGRYKIFPIVGLALTAVSFLLMTTVQTSTPPQLYGLYMAMMGLGISACGPTMTISVQNAVELRDLGTATSSIAFFRSMGGSFGVALLGAILFAGLSHQTEGAAAGVSAGGLLHGGPAAIAALPQATHDAVVASFGRSFQTVFLTGAAISALALVFAFFLKEIPLRSHLQRQAEKLAAAPPRDAKTA